MPTIVSNEADRSEEATMRQVSLICDLLERRRVSARCASKIIELLVEEPVLNGSGLEDLKVIQRPE